MSKSTNPKHPDFEGAIEFARQSLISGLPPQLSYHCVEHTFDNVLSAAMRLAELCQVNAADKQLLAVAAAFHDIGWTVQSEEHERAGAAVVRSVLPSYGFSKIQIETIAQIILATRLPAVPTTLLQEILVDADLDVLGREDFWDRNLELRTELEADGQQISDIEWLRGQLRFLSEHQYFTKAARDLRDTGKQKNIARLKQLLKEATARQAS